MAALFGSPSLRFVCSVIVLLLGFLASAPAQDKPVASQPSASDASVQTSSGDQSQTQAAPVVQAGPEQRLVHIVPYGRGTNASTLKNTSAPAGAHLTYFGGPVISNVHVVVVFWGTNVDPVVTSPGTIDQFFSDITNSRYYDLLTEYSTAGVTGVGTPVASSNQTIGRGQFDATVTIIPSVCPGPTTCSLTDNQIQAELTSQLAAGHLPAPVKDAQGIIETFYMIYFPPGVHISLGGAPSCAAGGFCAYHSNTSSLVPYGVLPDFGPTSGCQAPHCGSGTEFQNITAVTSHEMSEAVTDAQIGSAPNTPTPEPPIAWYDFPPNLGEVGDICGGQDVTVSAGAHTYTVQQEFSNIQNDCVSAPPVFNLTMPASGAGPSLPFNGTLTIQSSAAPFTLSGYTGTVHFTSSDSQAVLPADYTFVSADAGSHQFSFTLKTLGNQTITVTDTHSAGFTGTATINVNTTPDLTISKSHVGNFIVGQPGTYTITVSNQGNGPTVGTVTVADTLPTGLAATAISGTGWNCDVGTVTCSRTDALVPTNSYPAISLVVNASGVAPTRVTNTVSVSGGGETNTSNDSATDLTNISAPDLIVGIAPGIFFQGATGATYAFFPGNNGDLPTAGTVTVKDTVSAGITPTAISGLGWSCTLATLTCTRADSAPAFTGYPVIQLTVDVALNAPSTVTNVVTISGGGESNTANDTAQDVSGVGPPHVPDITVSISHAGSGFVQGQTGTYTVQVSNAGLGASSGTISVTASLPPSLTPTSLGGPGWTCTLGTLTCTRSDVLGGGLFSNTIILNVNVASNAPATVTANAVVSGGGDTNTTNNSSSDPTQIAAPLVDLNTSLAAGFPAVFQGETNLSYGVMIGNLGNIPSSGTITVTNTLSAAFTATAISGTGWNCTLSNLTCTRSDALTVNNGFPSIIITFNIANNAPGTGQLSATVSGGGDGNSANNASTFPLTIAPAIQIQPSVGTITVNAGQPAIFNLVISGQATVGLVNLSCSGLPTATSCNFNPPAAGPGTIDDAMTITTTASSVIVGKIELPANRVPFLLAVVLSFMLLLAVYHHFRVGRFRRFKPVLGLMALLMAYALAIAGCGGGSSPPPPPHVIGTPAGTYTITVTGTGPTNTTSKQVILIVR